MFEAAHRQRQRTGSAPSAGRLVLVALALALVGCGGYYVGALREPALSHLPANATVALEHLVSADSFSEVAQARAVLDALADRYVEYAQMLMVQEHPGPSVSPVGPEANRETPQPAAIQLIEEAVAEFEGTGAERRFVPTLLSALKRAGLHDRWLDLYLRTLYESPAHPSVGVRADEAIWMGQAAGREEEVVTAFRHLLDIPLEFTTKTRIARCLIWLESNFQTVSHPHEPALIAPKS